MSYISKIQDTIRQVLNCCGKDLFTEENEPCSTVMEHSSIAQTHATPFDIQTNPVYCAKKLFLSKTGSGMPLLPTEISKETLRAQTSKFVMRFVSHYDQDERETDGAVHWNSINPKLLRAFQKARGRTFSDWLRHISEGSNKTRFQHCMNFRNFLMYISGHSRTHWWESDRA